MAIKTIEVHADTSQAAASLENLSKSLDKVDKSAKSVDSTFAEVYDDLQPLTSRMGEAEDRLYELALAGQSASEEYKELLARVGQYREVQMKTDMAVDAAATTLDAKLGGALQGVTSAFAGVQGAMALTGGQSEELEAAILKVQGAMALAEGVRGLREGSVAFKALGTSAKAALSGIRTGIAATGIGVLLIALGAVVAYWDDIKEAVGGVSAEQEALTAKSKENLTAEQKKLDAISEQENTLRAQGLSEKDILKLKIQQTDQVILKAEADLKNAEANKINDIARAKRNKEILSDIIKYMQYPLVLILRTVDSVGKALGKDFGLESKLLDTVSSFVFDPVKVEAEADAAIEAQKKGITKLRNDQDGFRNQVKAIDNQAAKDAADKRKEANDKAIQAEKDKKDALERIRQGEIDTEAERRAEELRQVQNQYAELIAEAEKFGKDTTALKEAQRTKEKELADKFKKEDEEKELEYWTTQSEKAVARDAEAKTRREKEIADEQAVADAKLAIQNAGIDNVSAGIGLLKGLFEKNKAIQKGLLIAENAAGIAKTIINTVAANAKAVAASPLTGGQPWVTLNSVSAGIGIASSIAATVKGLSALGGGGNAGSSSGVPSGGSGGGSPAPSFNVVGNSGVNQIAQTLGAQQPVQAYVVASNVTTQQSLDRNIVANASLG